MSYVDVLEDQIRWDLDRCVDALDWLDAHGPDIIREIAEQEAKTILPIPGIHHVTDHIVQPAIDALHKGVSEARKGVAFGRRLVAYGGDPDGLRAAAEAFGSTVSHPAVLLSERMVAGNLDTTNTARWSDGAASATYVQKFGGRAEATKRIQELADPLASGLGDLADAIEHFYIDLAGVVVGYLGMVGGIVAAVVGAPAAGVGAIPGLVVAFIGLVAFGISLADFLLNVDQTTRNLDGTFSGSIEAWPAVLH